MFIRGQYMEVLSHLAPYSASVREDDETVISVDYPDVSSA